MKPFEARILCGTVAGLLTMLAVYYLGLPGDPPIHFGVAVILGILAEGEGLGKILDSILLKISNFIGQESRRSFKNE